MVVRIEIVNPDDKQALTEYLTEALGKNFKPCQDNYGKSQFVVGNATDASLQLLADIGVKFRCNMNMTFKDGTPTNPHIAMFDNF